jgi:hypothetical protein
VSLLDPVTPFLTLIDRIISLLKTRGTKRREYFEKIIDPLYAQFKLLGENYLKLFHVAQEAIQSHERAKRRRAVVMIRAKREEFAAARKQLRALLFVCEDNSKNRCDEELTEFVRAMSRFFVPKTEQGNSLGWQLVDVFEAWGERRIEPIHAWERRIEPDEARHFIRDATAYLEASWFELAGRYMKLKLRYLEE